LKEAVMIFSNRFSPDLLRVFLLACRGALRHLPLFAALLAALATTRPAAAAPPTSPQERQIDALFAKWNRPDTPGAVVAVIRDGKVLLSKAYGMADLERGVPLTVDSKMTVGSNSKQFTAFAIHLLAQDGKLSLDDDVRTYVPEVPDFGKTITIRHLLHHTSGLRDFFELMELTGWRGDEVVTQEDVLTLIERQRALNFAPGQEHWYSNTNYMLLGLIVERVSGKLLADFARERIFEPLGMKHTQFLHGYGTVVPGRALSYALSNAGGYEYVAFGDSMDGAGGLVSTVGDLALWDRNFYDGRVGGKDLIARMQATGVLNDGLPINYASGLIVDAYRGRRIVEHGGSGGGFRAQLLRFPEQRFSVVMLANSAEIDCGEMVHAMADIYLDPAVAAARPAARAPATRMKPFREIALSRTRLDALVGFYAMSPEAGIEFTQKHGQLMAKSTGWPRLPAYASSEREFFAKDTDAQFTFDAPGPDGTVAGGVLHANGVDTPARRVQRPVPPAGALTKFEGDFYSDELRMVYSVANRNGNLEVTYPRGSAVLDFNAKGEFATGFRLGAIQYQCDAENHCASFTVTTGDGRVRNLKFNRVAGLRPNP
jgi:CubicO group peptidase (beta-lactamase class C family)